jgi:hypothetical protein
LAKPARNAAVFGLSRVADSSTTTAPAFAFDDSAWRSASARIFFGRPARAVAGAAGALLPVHFLAGERDLVPHLDLVVARAALGELPGDAALQDVGADLVDAEDVVRQLDGAALLAVQLDHVDFHLSLAPALGLRLGV